MKPLTLLLIHGYPFNQHLWDPVTAKLSGVPLLAPDLPGFGEKPVLQGVTPSMEAYAEALHQVCQNEGLERVVPAGMSMGGYVALAFAERYPEMIAGLALISSQPTADSPEAQKNRAELINKLQQSGWESALNAIQPKMFSPNRQQHPAHVGLLKSAAASAGVPGLTFALQAMANRQDRTSVLRQLRVPLLLAHGTEDQIVPFAKISQLSQELPTGELVPIEYAGHATPLEAPEQLAEALERLMHRAASFVADPSEIAHHKTNRPGIVWAPSDRGL
jgi:pimeloyl-ACP methyl ester carboxylesterase